jgi:tRNA-2-methylthio-N6-dimethylallyladenosine synthase
MPDQVLPEVVSERYRRLVELVDSIAWNRNKALVGSEVDVIIGDVPGRKDSAAGRVTGRARDNRLVHIGGVPVAARPGDAIRARVDQAAPHHLSAAFLEHRPTRAGDIWERNHNAACDSSSAGPIWVGVPAVRSERA